jgi:hypothetical protein
LDIPSVGNPVSLLGFRSGKPVIGIAVFVCAASVVAYML